MSEFIKSYQPLIKIADRLVQYEQSQDLNEIAGAPISKREYKKAKRIFKKNSELFALEIIKKWGSNLHALSQVNMDLATLSFKMDKNLQPAIARTKEQLNKTLEYQVKHSGWIKFKRLYSKILLLAILIVSGISYVSAQKVVITNPIHQLSGLKQYAKSFYKVHKYGSRIENSPVPLAMRYLTWAQKPSQQEMNYAAEFAATTTVVYEELINENLICPPSTDYNSNKVDVALDVVKALDENAIHESTDYKMAKIAEQNSQSIYFLQRILPKAHPCS